MLNLEAGATTQTAEPHRRPSPILVVAIVIVAGLGVATGIWALARDRGPVPAEEARIEVTFTGADASYDGDRQIVAGLGEVVLVNDGTDPAYLVVQYYEPGSAVLEADLARYPEGTDFVTIDQPTGELVILNQYAPGRTTEPVEFQPGTYYVEAALAGPDSTHVWRTAVIEVVAD